MPIDTHCHLADEVFEGDLEAVALRAQAAGVPAALCILAADDEAECARAGRVRHVWPAVRFAIGIHPHRAGQWADRLTDVADLVETAVVGQAAIAVGEIGLDYHYDFAAREVQQEVFAAQLAVAVRLDRPVVIHARDSIDDTIAAIGQAHGVRAVMHCFTGSVDEARRALDVGAYISLSGIVTFPRSQDLRDVAAFVPADRLLVETDAPFLAPVPHRGRRNEPAWVVTTLEVVARVRGVSPVDLAAAVDANARALLPALDAPPVR
jgi:TatD DNase family protein